jgi:hypothetical protein
MIFDLQYWRRSEVRESRSGLDLTFAPNLARPRVAYDGEVADPLRFREAISALHEVVVGDLRFKKRDKSAYQAWKQDEQRREGEVFRAAFDHTKREEIENLANEPVPPGLESDFRKMHSVYWKARRQWANELARHDPELFRALVPCDPVVTVASDVVFFECFSKDESSYGCLLVDRDAFRGETVAEPGTTNVDYSLELYDHFQTLRTYRPTRLLVDPTGFEVKVAGIADYREEKIDLPASWLRGFGQIQAAMSLPSKRLVVSREAVYSVLAFLRRHREKGGPRSLRFVLEPGEPLRLVLDPWGTVITSHGAVYDGAQRQEIKVWGRRRLLTLARVLPLAEKIEVALLGSGLPSVWIVHMAGMRLVLALSGWTTNDWTSSAALDLMAATYRPEPAVVETLGRFLARTEKAPLPSLIAAAQASADVVLGSLHQLSRQGQVIYDFATDCYRFRSVMPVALSEAVIGPEHPELVNGQRIHRERKVKVLRDEPLANNRRLIVARAEKTECEGVLDADGAWSRAKCSCSYFYKNRLRGGPCRHLLAAQLLVRGVAAAPPPKTVP